MDRNYPASRRSATFAAMERDAVKAANARIVDAATRRERDVVAEEHERFLTLLDRIARDVPVVKTAHWLLDQHQIRPVPLDANLEPAGDPLDTSEAVLDHYRNNPSHGVGVTTGPRGGRPWAYVAVKVDRFKAWDEWLRGVGKVSEKVRDLGGFADLGHDMAATGEPKTETRWRDTGGFSRLLWVPPPLPRLSYHWMDAAGGKLTEEHETRQAGRGGWIWLVVPDPDGTVKVRKPRKVTAGIELQPDGTVIPWEGSRTGDGWQLRLQATAHSGSGLGVPRIPPAPWLIKELIG